MFGVHWSRINGDIRYFICHMTLQDHITEGSSDATGENSLLYLATSTPKTFGGHKPCGSGSGDMFPICHLILQEHAAQEPFEFIGKCRST